LDEAHVVQSSLGHTGLARAIEREALSGVTFFSAAAEFVAQFAGRARPSSK